VRLRDELAARGSWAGETHLQKATYILQAAKSVPLGFEFILYKHGPFSFDLRDELTSLRADRLLAIQAAYPYGPQFVGTPEGAALISRFPKTLGLYDQSLVSVADLVGSRGVAELERTATALMFLTEDRNASDETLVAKVQEVKPHISQSDALSAVEEMRQFLDAAS
jgi:hypothetical protein